MTQITLQPAKVNEFLQVEDVTLTEKSGGVLDDTNSIYKNDVDKFLQVEDVTLTKKIRGCLKRYKYTLQSAKVNEFLPVEDVTLTKKSGGS